MSLRADNAAALKALDNPAADIRLYLLFGPDEAGSEALAARFARAMGPGAERVDLDGAALRSDPARLPDEAAAISMFGDRRWIRVQPAGEEVLPAVQTLLEADATGDPVVMIAGNLRKTSKLLGFCDAHKAAVTIVSYAPEGRNAEQLAVTMARESGLELPGDLARRLVALSGGERGLLAGEIEKLVLYLDATPEAPRAATDEALDALGAEGGEQQLFKAAMTVLSGNIRGTEQEMARLRQSGGSLAGLLRITLQRAVGLAQTQAGQGQRYGGRGDDDLAQRWSADDLGRAIRRMAQAERTSRLSHGMGETVLAQELVNVARLAARRR
ncbi:putative DNA polymerase III subunit delta [Sphingobium sp. SYK-6]|uniref:putative DNA polymerase III subunit delta n=1 Tax=Sphingobium sp. (strain NBRC 103272 / SYK-6) TaxID=627192 RepID=UPI0002277EC3|nr:putative DNA polymerase III subunit delta [Sphingobium sp. SYK-6]BAK68439.1 putative DNA polymerase III subunit delta [Sphingobium sp. SYK-6]